MLPINKRISEILAQRSQSDTLRSLKPPKQGIDFLSNDYLGLACNREFQEILLSLVNANPSLLLGATGSRLISGNSEYTMDVEEWIAKEHRAEAALLFPSGFVANMALLSCLPKRGDTLIMDEFVHRSVRDGARLSVANCHKFRHNDLNHLEELLKKSKGMTFVAIESLYSMEGDFAPLEEIVALTERYQAALIVDEAHSFGVFNHGLVAKKNLQDKVFATTITYGKAMGLHGATILGSTALISYLVNHAAAFNYTTASSDWHAASLKQGYQFIHQNPNLSQTLQQRINEFKLMNIPTISDAKSPIQIVNVTGSTEAKKLQKELEAQNLLTFAVVAPTVKAGHERIRIGLHAFNTEKEVNLLTETLNHHLNL